MDKNCKITIQTKSTKVSYSLNDYRIAIAIRNILDNVAELEFDDNNFPELMYISKEFETLDSDPDCMAQKCKQNACYGSLVQELFKGGEQNG